ncbi:uncharacterized protein LOC113226149 [Hyposmocoma kahamanoa]|uniref:uncharacterized protein LOC113226149 n=1 Tax=Hyposmocoma kahamanoa TaxID=1477025 RepID=UPI000E6D8355|nr:uncharacterized protein LOC113226149 [Hyposmocoma kahamanoa]
MTVITKISVTTKPPTPPPPDNDDKSYFIGDPSVGVDEDVIVASKKRVIPMICVVVLCSLLFACSSGLVFLLYEGYSQYNATPRYTGYCNIPIDLLRQENLGQVSRDQLIEPNYREHHIPPLTWFANPDVQIFSTDEGAADAFVNSLREEFDVGGRIEKIRVFDNGKTISFIHDFEDNVTGIIDQDRCFLMDLDPSLVLDPELLVFAIQNGEEFDLTRVHTTLRALIPALVDLNHKARALAERCNVKPTYRLKNSGPMIRKRSLDAPPHDYIHFAGKHIQEIEIANLGELLQHEQDM